MKQSWPLAALIMLFAFTGCKNEVLSPQAPAGDHTLTVKARAFDDFGREVLLVGPVSIQLVGEGRSLRTTIPAGTTSCQIHGLPAQEYLLTAKKEGYFPSTATAGVVVGGTGTWSQELLLYPHPSPSMKIDSLTVTTLTHPYAAHLLTIYVPQSAPLDYLWKVAIFFSSSPAIDPSSPGTYERDTWFGGIPQGTGHALTYGIVSSDLPAPSGTRVYATARLMTPATLRFALDSTLHHYRYTDLETNTKAVTSFIVP